MKYQRMWLNWLLAVFLNTNHLVNSFSFEADDFDPEAEWESMESLPSSGNGYDSDLFVPKSKRLLNTNPPLKLPASVRIPADELYKEHFTPEKGSKPIPPLVQSILLPTAPTEISATPVPGEPKTVEVLCYLDRMYVRVLKSFCSSPGARTHLKLGTCAVNKATATHYYLLYPLKGCGVEREEDANRVTYTNTLHYTPSATGLIVRDLPFSMQIRCSYTKFHRSYQVGFIPKIAGGTLYRGLQTPAGFSLTAMDASWNSLADGQSFVLGQPVCFEAKGPRVANKRLYMNSCFVSSTPYLQAVEKYSVVENYGCLVDSKNSFLTKFHTSVNKMTVRLCVAAFLFENMISLPQSKQTMFMHCELVFGPQTPTPTAKSCTYDAQTNQWTELHGGITICDCCASTCPTPQVPSVGKTLITSDSWDLKMRPETSSPLSPESMPESSLSGHDDFDLFWESDDY
ncbi:zona pellucida sperm-binding protein 3 isoform X1 [Carassius gibelio]|uniref:zona pellucida sperm-binding protein 3 isoform X1 n=1 Tax=Carassius gibelio TaxID=101364 RepID=UPI0022785F16|nr:zona pellucida sperm-binding protein 3 isoform X1 [Carassius gibelio]